MNITFRKDDKNRRLQTKIHGGLDQDVGSFSQDLISFLCQQQVNPGPDLRMKAPRVERFRCRLEKDEKTLGKVRNVG